MAKKKEEVEVPQLVVVSKIKLFASEEMSLRVSGDFVEALNAFVCNTIERAAERCESNNRQTLKPSDL